jgi:hypothetical protein
MLNKYQSYMNYAILLAILLGVGFLYNRYNNKLKREKSAENHDAIRKYLLNDFGDDMENGKNKKPIMWIHLNYEYNSRDWASFGSRSSINLNQPYLYLTANSIIKQCEDDFHICFIDDGAFSTLLPEWKIKINHVSDPVKKNIRDLGMTKLLYKYGGIRVPISFVCMRNLIDMYNTGTKHNNAFICETIDRNVTSTHYDFYPNIEFMGAPPNCRVIGNLVDFMQRTISRDYTSQSVFLGDFNRWCNTGITKGRITMIGGKLIGVKTMDNEEITIDTLLSNEYIDLYSNAYGIYIPADEVLKRTNYEWFARMSPTQILESTLIISKYLLLANAPDAKQGIIEPLKQKEDWISFWRVPSGAPVWGFKPTKLGNNVPKMTYP